MIGLLLAISDKPVLVVEIPQDISSHLFPAKHVPLDRFSCHLQNIGVDVRLAQNTFGSCCEKVRIKIAQRSRTVQQSFVSFWWTLGGHPLPHGGTDFTGPRPE